MTSEESHPLCSTCGTRIVPTPWEKGKWAHYPEYELGESIQEGNDDTHGTDIAEEHAARLDADHDPIPHNGDSGEGMIDDNAEFDNHIRSKLNEDQFKKIIRNNFPKEK
jgi:hypothetical protein